MATLHALPRTLRWSTVNVGALMIFIAMRCYSLLDSQNIRNSKVRDNELRELEVEWCGYIWEEGEETNMGGGGVGRLRGSTGV